MECIFCRIVNQEMDATKIYENDKAISFLDIAPLSNGHSLVIPKYHANNLFDLPQDYWMAMHTALTATTKAIEKVLGFTDFNFMNNHGKNAGQVVFHYHMHIIPREQNDGLNTIHDRHKITLSKETITKMQKTALLFKHT